MASYEKEEIATLDRYVALIEAIKTGRELSGNHSDLLFRGQSRDFPMIPKLARLDLKGDILSVEKLMLEEFRRGCVPLAEYEPDNEWDLLALAQHHGLPTRLLDWTYSALVALWFAVSEPAYEDNHAVVWVLTPEPSDFRTNTEELSPLSNKITKIFRSKVVSKRISAQSGVFTAHKIVDETKVIRFENNRAFSKKLTKIIIPSTNFSNLRKQLNILGVNNSTVYPDIDGFCKHLEWRFSKLSDELT